MTGYGRGVGGTDDFKVTCELKGVNGRYFDAKFYIPTRHMNVESSLKKLAKKELSRGRLDIYFRYDCSKSTVINDKIKEKLKLLISEMKEIKNNEELELKISVGDILLMVNHINENSQDVDEDDKIIESAYIEATKNALESYSVMRYKEGKAISEELRIILGKAVSLMKEIEKKAPEISISYQEKLNERIKKLLDGRKVDEIVLLNEVAVIADKTDVREEIFRFFEHASGFESLLNEDIIGKKLDFLIQEMHREVNTIGSKTQDIDISNKVIDIKTFVEQLREQIQNIE